MLKNYLYTYSYHEDEDSLCKLEMRSFFGFDTPSSILESPIKINPSRSPFMKARLDEIFRSTSIEQLIEEVRELKAFDRTCKVMFVQNGNQKKTDKIGFQQRRLIEREVGLNLPGEVDLINPEVIFGLLQVENGWVFGEYVKGKSVWFEHQVKPHHYSTALSTRVARAVVNIAVPNPTGVKVIDPCCGIGTILVEALSMKIDIVGRDLNPLVISGARENITYFGFVGEVVLGDMRNVIKQYDVAIIDMPYNLCSVLPSDIQLEMLNSAHQYAKKVIIITIEPIDSILDQVGFRVLDRCVARKGSFSRDVIVCESVNM